ncbi:MAG: hypothetical protein SP1CHLAM54_13870 [Chlamydiia bacterium]|nr:hypothetical protein [Chlamydiia bacterium]MCH9616280.1 hypothetical protein [Chlamydiia bacterium]MCH9629734.1 hypothetical protein [Chlamydiia bacterium]
MKLRTRLFLWVGTLFLIAFVASFYLEDYLTKTNLEKAEVSLEGKIMAQDEYKRRHLEEYLLTRLSYAQANIDGLLARIAETAYVRDGFAPTGVNKHVHTWLNTTSLRITDPWIDFVQNLIGSEVAALVIHNSDAMESVKYHIYDEDIAFAMVGDDKTGLNGPYVGIRLEYDFSEIQPPMMIGNAAPAYYALFTPETIKTLETKNAIFTELDLSLNFLQPLLKWIEIPSRRSFIVEFLQRLNKAKALIENGKVSLPGLKSFISARPLPSKKVLAKELFLENELPKQTMAYLEEIDGRYDQIGMTWGLATLLSSGVFSETYDPRGKDVPLGLLRVTNDPARAMVVRTDKVLFDQPFISLEGCKASFSSDKATECLADKMVLITPPEVDSVFIGNSLRIKDGKELGYVTIGVDNRRFLEEIALVTHEVSAFISGNHLINVVDADGKEMPGEKWKQLPIDTLLRKNSGLISVGDEQYFFLHMKPFENMDFHFVIFNPKQQEFALLENIQRSSEKLIGHISFNMRIAGIVALLVVLGFLMRISRRITKPISHLAEATTLVAEGQLDAVEIPDVLDDEKIRKDEIEVLYHAFFKMVKGLQEKERVRGILNKVVSQEIAEETLKGNVHLGGEEKMVTVFFADIRNFTKMTERMPPQEVIHLINECMTKISHIIDSHGGVIDKYVGDEVMGLFGAPVSKEDSALNAILSATEIMETLSTWNKEREAAGEDIIEMGIGIHTGLVVAGNMGADNRLNYTVLGSNVNLASRMCGAAGKMQVLISEATYEQPHVKESIEVEALSPMTMKGFTEPVSVYEVKKAKS